MDVHRTTLCAALGLALLGIVLFPWPPQGQAVPKSGTPWSDFVRTLYPVPRWRWVVAPGPFLNWFFD